MKKIFKTTTALCFICVAACTNLYAQHRVTISGNTCPGSILTANITGATAEKIEWKLNGETIAEPGSPRDGVTVAGGNGAGGGPINYITQTAFL